jgi:hypothetical protein
MPELVLHAASGGLFDRYPLIELHENEDGQIVINNGHHRVTAVWLAGRKVLHSDEYVLFYKDAYRPRCGQVQTFFERLSKQAVESCLQALQ